MKPIVRNDGRKDWYDKDGKCHRDDGPAVELANGTKVWYAHGKLHRDDGPAIEYANGDKAWYVHAKFIAEVPAEATAVEDQARAENKQRDVMLAEIAMISAGTTHPIVVSRPLQFKKPLFKR
jgi:hypothetical protein